MNDITTAPQRDITASEIQSFIAYLDVSEKSRSTYIAGVKKLAEYLIAHGITRPTREDILAYKRELAETVKPTTAQLYIVTCRMFFAWLECSGIYPNVAEHIKGVKLDREHKKDALTSSQVKHILSTIDSKRDRALFMLMVTTGLRTCEVSRANLSDMRSMGGKTVLHIQGKGKADNGEFVIIPAIVEQAIREYLTERASESGALFESRSNHSTGRLSSMSISRIIKSIMQKAGYSSERLTAHSLRHTAVTLALLAGEKLESVRDFARHANINTTMIYAHSLDKLNNGCSNTIAESIV